MPDHSRRRVRARRMTQPPTTTAISREVRKFVFDYFEEHACAPVLEQIMQKFKLDRPTAYKSLVELESAHHIFLVPGTQRILMAFPFSSVVTPFRVRLADTEKEYFANCAWDSVAIHVMLRKEQWIESFCHHCAENIDIHLRDQRKVSSHPSDNPLVYLSLPAAKWWENIMLTCSNNMVFFSSPEHLAAWKRTNPSLRGEALNIQQTIDLSAPIYRTKMTLDYTRPTREQTIAHFTSLGLTGDFWKL
jgi:hypothetical protein